MTPEEEADKDQRFEPNYDVACTTCGQKPTYYDTGLCGACCFGDASCIDPDNW